MKKKNEYLKLAMIADDQRLIVNTIFYKSELKQSHKGGWIVEQTTNRRTDFQTPKAIAK